MDKQIRGLGKAGLLPARPKSSNKNHKNHSHALTHSPANGPTPGAVPPTGAPLLPPPEPRADSVTSPPPLVISTNVDNPSAAPRLPVIAESAPDGAASAAHDASGDALAQPSLATVSAADASEHGEAPAPPHPEAAAEAEAADTGTGALAATATATAASPAAQDSPVADQPSPSGRRKPRKSRPLADTAPEPPAKRVRGGSTATKRGSSGGSRSRGKSDDGADLVGLRVEVPGSVFYVDTPGLVYVCDIKRKDDKKRNAVEVVFRDDNSVYWFPVADVRRWLAEQKAREAAGTVPLVAGPAGAVEAVEGEESEGTVVDEAVEGRRKRKGKTKTKKSGATAVRRRAHLAAAAAAREDGSSLGQEGEKLDADEELAAQALTDISVGVSRSRGGHPPVDSHAARGTSRLHHAS